MSGKSQNTKENQQDIIIGLKKMLILKVERYSNVLEAI